MTSNNTSTRPALQHQPSAARKSFLRKRSFESSCPSPLKWLTLLDKRGRNFLIPEDLFLAVYRSGLNSCPSELAPCLAFIQSEHYDAAIVDEQLERLFTQNGVSIEELERRLNSWKDGGLPPHPDNFPVNRSLMSYFWLRLLSHSVPLGVSSNNIFLPQGSVYERLVHRVSAITGTLEAIFWTMLIISASMSIFGAAVKTETLATCTTALTCFLTTWGSHSAHEAMMWSHTGYRVRHEFSYRRFVLTHSRLPSMGKSAYSVLLKLVRNCGYPEDQKAVITYIPDHVEHHEKTTAQPTLFTKFDLWDSGMDIEHKDADVGASINRK